MIDHLNKQFGLGTELVFEQGRGGLAKAVLNNRYGSAEIYLQGAHVTQYQPAATQPVIWISDAAVFSAAKAIRGGIPICWPWFGAHPTQADFPQHGFARSSEWVVQKTESSATAATSIKLSLRHDSGEQMWPHPFRVDLTLSLGEELSLALQTFNPAPQSLDFSAALHSYFNVSDSRKILITGLDKCQYLDKPDQYALKQQGGDIRIEGEVDRIYLDTRADCVIEDPGFDRRIIISKQGSCSTVVWNPGAIKAAQMADFDDEGYLRMVCVESANAERDRRCLESNQQHRLVQSIRVL